ncbi:Target of EGR1, member 1 (Nuclear) [Linnemannia zychae]|nr:Target of EGR1, member 1 (Nuclear) [Linnemannia zychae]
MQTAPAMLPIYNQVTKHNLAQMQPMIIHLLKEAAFIALDAEFTGLGSNSQTTRAKDIQDRYQHLCKLAKSHALIAFGLSLFVKVESTSLTSGKEENVDSSNDEKLLNNGKRKRNDEFERAYKVHNFNFSVLAERDFMVSPNSMVFLAENGLDLNQWIMEGIPYTGGDRLTNEGGRGNPNGIMRSIFKRIMTRQVPVVVHNGFLDLIFLYHSFYADLPPNLSTFLADLSDMFPGGLLPLPPIQKIDISESIKAGSQVLYCEDYAFHGVCKKKMQCGKSHDLDLILDAEEKERDSKKRQKHKHEPSVDEAQTTLTLGTVDSSESFVNLSDSTGKVTAAAEVDNLTDNNIKDPSETSITVDTILSATTSSVETQQKPSMRPTSTKSTSTDAISIKETVNVVQTREKFHSAYYDAFMTGTIFLYQLHRHGIETIEAQAKNKIYLIGKSFPLTVEKSNFTKYSPSHERQRTQ